MSEETQKQTQQLEEKENKSLPDQPEGKNLFGANQPKEKSFTWEFEGKTYDLLLVNRTGGIGMPILNPRDKKTQIGILTAEFAWQNSAPFIDRLDIETIDKANEHDDWTQRENENMILKNSTCFSEIVVRGSAIDIDEATGERKAEVKKTRDQMLAYRKVVQSDLISNYLREFHIERWLPDGMTKLDALLSNPTELFFTIKIGDYKNPRHLLFVETAVPTDDAITNYKSDTFNQSQNEEGDWRYKRNNEKRLRFGKKYIRSVKGAMLGPAEQFEFDDSQIRTIEPTDDKAMTDFKANFNPDWIIKIAEEISGAFDLGKK
jgi:hypothetical protein